jgi:hypothetical protein
MTKGIMLATSNRLHGLTSRCSQPPKLRIMLLSVNVRIEQSMRRSLTQHTITMKTEAVRFFFLLRHWERTTRRQIPADRRSLRTNHSERLEPQIQTTHEIRCRTKHTMDERFPNYFSLRGSRKRHVALCGRDWKSDSLVQSLELGNSWRKMAYHVRSISNDYTSIPRIWSTYLLLASQNSS